MLESIEQNSYIKKNLTHASANSQRELQFAFAFHDSLTSNFKLFTLNSSCLIPLLVSLSQPVSILFLSCLPVECRQTPGAWFCCRQLTGSFLGEILSHSLSPSLSLHPGRVQIGVGGREGGEKPSGNSESLVCFSFFSLFLQRNPPLPSPREKDRLKTE